MEAYSVDLAEYTVAMLKHKLDQWCRLSEFVV